MNVNRNTICARCVMDTTDPSIQFDEKGVCNHCRTYELMMQQWVLMGEAGRQKIGDIAATLRQRSLNRRYDCVIGVSGGVDSTYVAYSVKRLGLRPLAVHLDNGWDSELAVRNIENVCRTLQIDLQTVVLDWEEFRDLQLAFLKASTPDSEIPSDHAIVASMYHTARRLRVPVIAGYNHRTESHLPAAWSQGHYDWRYIRSVQAAHGTKPLKSFPHLNWIQGQRFVRGLIPLLNYMSYSKTEAMPLLEKEVGWRYYGKKHYESIYTRFYQGYFLPRKFGYDKRKSHLSSLICSGEITREAAVRELEQDTYPVDLQEQDKEYVIKKLRLTTSQFDDIIRLPKNSFWDYPSYAALQRLWFSPFVRMLYRNLLKERL